MSLRAAFAGQASTCIALGSPFMGRLMTLAAHNLTDRTAIGARLFAWEGDVTSRAGSLPLRFAGGLHRLVLTGRDAALAAVYPPHQASDRQLWHAVENAMMRYEPLLLNWLDSPPQTNEVRRSAALIPAFHMIASATGLPLHLSELGASAGLNLMADRFHLTANGADFGALASGVQLVTDWHGPIPGPTDLQVAGKDGVDLRPVDLNVEDEVQRLLCYLWADQPERMARTQASITLTREADLRITAGDAADFLTEALAHPKPTTAHVIFHTVAWQYFPDETAHAAQAAIDKAGARATDDAPLFHLAMEADDSNEPGAALTLTAWPGPRRFDLGRADFHGRWVRWRGPTAL